MRRLPPLTAVEAFVHVARIGSVKAAAETLALSSPALTRRIQALERFVGHPLFERGHQSITLNADGDRLLAELGPSLDALAAAMERATGGDDLMRLRLAVPSLFASQRLMPVLPDLRALHPDLHIDIDTGAGRLLRLNDGVDAAIVITAGTDPILYSRQIDQNRVVAVGTRALSEGPNALLHPSQLSEATIYLHREMPDAFQYWCDAAGVPNLQPAAIDVFDAGQLILDAAAQGLGVAFMLESHLRASRDDRLVELFGIEAESPYSYWFVCRRSALSRRPVKIFHDWLFSGQKEGSLARV